MRVQDFLFWDSEHDLRYELVDGEPRAMAPANTIHALLQNELGRLIGNHLRNRGTKCDVLANPGVIPQSLSAHNMRVPDLGVSCSPVTPPQPAMNDPLLLVEILSPSNQAKTRSNVWP
jgi:Uma2 family endonuclease